MNTPVPILYLKQGQLALNVQQNYTGRVATVQPTMLLHYLTLSGLRIGWEGQNVLTRLSVPIWVMPVV